MASDNKGYFHEDNGGEFVKGLPTKPGYYWHRFRGFVSPCEVLLGGPSGHGGTWWTAVVMLRGWHRRENDPPPPGVPGLPQFQNFFAIDDPFVQESEYAPMSPPGGW